MENSAKSKKVLIPVQKWEIPACLICETSSQSGSATLSKRFAGKDWRGLGVLSKSKHGL